MLVSATGTVLVGKPRKHLCNGKDILPVECGWDHTKSLPRPMIESSWYTQLTVGRLTNGDHIYFTMLLAGSDATRRTWTRVATKGIRYTVADGLKNYASEVLVTFLCQVVRVRTHQLLLDVSP